MPPKQHVQATLSKGKLVRGTKRKGPDHVEMLAHFTGAHNLNTSGYSFTTVQIDDTQGSVTVGNRQINRTAKKIRVTLEWDEEKGEHKSTSWSAVPPQCTIKVEGGVKGNINITAGNVMVKGGVQGNVTTETGNISIEGKVGGNAHTETGNMFITR